MSAKKKEPQDVRRAIVNNFMEYTLEQEQFPKSVYKFCTLSNIKEFEFYQEFGSLDGLKSAIWELFFIETQKLLLKEKEYPNYSVRDKMLTFYYTFFELLSVNRSYILFALHNEGHPLKHLEQLKGLRRHVKGFARERVDEHNESASLKITRQNPTLFSEGAWLQLLFLLNFWIKDESPGQEKTDMAIEKSVNTLFDVFDNTPLERVVDFGKFLFKEAFV